MSSLRTLARSGSVASIGRDLGHQGVVEALGEVRVLAQAAHDRPQVDLLLLDRRVVVLELVLPVIERGDDGVELVLARTVLVEVVAQLVARTERQQAEELVGAEHVALPQGPAPRPGGAG